MRRPDSTEVGPNRIPSAPGVSPLVILGNQLRSVVVGLLAAAILLSLLIGDHLEAVAIAVVLVVNAALGFATEWRARRAMEALLLLEAARALVFRDGRLQIVPAETIVPGDVVQLDAGNRVPADVRLLEAADFSTDEAALTGESMPAEKQTDPLPSDAVVADRTNMAYLGTAVASGTALAVVVATGRQTELGRIGTLVNAIEDAPTPLERRLDVLGRRLAWLTIGVAGAGLGDRRAQRRTLGQRARDRHRARRRRDAGGIAGRRDDCAGGRHAPDGAPARAGAPAAVGRVAGLDDRRLHRQDPDADDRADDGRQDLDGLEEIARPDDSAPGTWPPRRCGSWTSRRWRRGRRLPPGTRPRAASRTRSTLAFSRRSSGPTVAPQG